MASQKIKLLLGYDDEEIDDKYEGQVDFTTNKIGGKPDWPPGVVPDPMPCSLCQLPRLLVVQIYAPLDASSYHRTLHVFACINPNCWNHNESWSCVRTQMEDPEKIITCKDPKVVKKVLCWLQDYHDWGTDTNANSPEKNGNLQEEDKVDEKLECLSVDDKNANSGSLAEAQGGAVGCLQTPTATAEIEGNEGEIISIDTPTFPQNDIIAILQEVTPLPQEFCQIEKQADLQFVPYFMNVHEKQYKFEPDEYVRQLMYSGENWNKYSRLYKNYSQKDDAEKMCDGEETLEQYEDTLPAHGDKMFHHFSLTIKADHGHILRYELGSTPVLLRPIQDVPKKCSYCQSEMIFEFQILPTLIPVLQLTTDHKEERTTTRLEYGNVLVYTCSKSCWSTGASPKVECVVVQAEAY